MNLQNPPPHNDNSIPWQRVLIRSGFYFHNVRGCFDFSNERESNRAFLSSILVALDQRRFDGNKFFPSVSTINEAEWLAAVEMAHGPGRGLESGTLSHDINLKDVDVYIAGVVRWLNTAGFETVHSCDGHNMQTAEIDFRNRNDRPLFAYALETISHGEWKFRGRGLFEHGNAPRPNRNQESTPQMYDHIWLLDVAEALHRHQDELRDFVRAAQRLAQSTL